MLAFFALFKYWRMWLLIGVLTAIVGTVGYFYLDFETMKSDLAVAKANDVTLTQANTQQKSALDLCTANTDKLKSDSDAWAQKAAAAELAAQQVAQPHFDTAKAILAKKPVVGESDYQATQDLINSLIPARGK